METYLVGKSELDGTFACCMTLVLFMYLQDTCIAYVQRKLRVLNSYLAKILKCASGLFIFQISGV